MSPTGSVEVNLHAEMMHASRWLYCEPKESINSLAHRIHIANRDKGFWDEPRNFGEVLMLVTTELAEALEEQRAGRPAVWHREDGKPEGEAVEIVDAIIRLLDAWGGRYPSLSLAQVIEEKLTYNASRPHKHGKAF